MLDLFDCLEPPDTLHIKVTPRAKSERVDVERSPEGSVLYKVYVREAPESGKANHQVITLLSKRLGVSKSSLSIVRGQFSRFKVIKISY